MLSSSNQTVKNLSDMRNLLLFLLFSAMAAPAYAQLPAGTDSTAGFEIVAGKDDFEFRPKLRPLQVIPGGRSPFYTYLWDFGDGHFSTDSMPRHRYALPGNYTVQLYAVNNYDDGKRPPRPVKRQNEVSEAMASVTSPSNAEKNFFSANGVFQLAKNTNALPGEDMLLIAGLRAPQGKGHLLILTNEKIYGPGGFKQRDASSYYGEKQLNPDSVDAAKLWASVSQITVTQSGSPHYNNRQDRKVTADEANQYFRGLFAQYNTKQVYTVKSETDKSAFSFIQYDITPEMLKDTNAMVTITGIYFPEDGGDAYVHQLEVPVVASHDPNRMSLKQSRMSYRMMAKRKEMLYKVQFQNDGEGDARNIRLEIDLPANMDPSTFRLLQLSPNCPPCSDSITRGCWEQTVKEDKTIVFNFRWISLPGTKAKDISNEDSTKGFIRFVVKPRKKLPNQAFRGRTAIYFDKNEPIITNTATGRFRKSLSPIVFAAHQLSIQDGDVDKEVKSMRSRQAWSLGVGLSPLAPYKKLYWQVELYGGTVQQQTDYGRVFRPGSVTIDGVDYNYDFYERKVSARILRLDVVPVQLRYNIGHFVSVGAGVQCKLDLPLSAEENRTIYPFVNGQERKLSQTVETNKGGTGPIRFRPFADINIGKILLGPCIGARYQFDGKQGQYVQVYGAWRL